MAKIVVETPRGKIIQTKSKNGTIVAELKWKPGFGSEYSAKYNQAQSFVDSEVLRLCDPNAKQGSSFIRYISN